MVRSKEVSALPDKPSRTLRDGKVYEPSLSPETPSRSRLRDGKVHEPSPHISRKRSSTALTGANDGSASEPLTSDADHGHEEVSNLSTETPKGPDSANAKAVEPSQELEADFISFPSEITTDPFTPGKGLLSKGSAKHITMHKRNQIPRAGVVANSVMTDEDLHPQPTAAIVDDFPPTENGGPHDKLWEDTTAGKAVSQQNAMPNSHKRFESEEPLVGIEAARIEQQEAESTAGGTVASMDNGGASSDEDAPEILDTKSAIGNIKKPFTATKKTRRKAKPCTIAPVSEASQIPEVTQQPEEAELDEVMRDTSSNLIAQVDPSPSKASEALTSVDPSSQVNVEPKKVMGETLTSTLDVQVDKTPLNPTDNPPSSNLDSQTGAEKPATLRGAASSPQRSHNQPSDIQPPSKRRKLFAEPGKPIHRDILKDGTTYRPLASDEPAVAISRKQTTSHLPPPSNPTSRKVKEHMLVRKRVQHIWGGRSAFLRS